MLREITRTTTHNCFLDPHNDILFYLKDNQILSRNTSEQQQHSKPFIIPQSYKQTTASPTEHRLQLISGDVAFNKDKTLFTNTSENVSIVKGTISTKVGTTMLWQFFAPISLIGISFGVCRIKPKQKQKIIGENEKYEFILIQLNASTSRTVTLMVNQKKLFCWVNGSKPNKHHIKDLQTQEGWFPCFSLKSYGNSIIYNPFSIIPNSNFSIYNPFQMIKKQAPAISNKISQQKKNPCQIKRLIQLNNNTILLINTDNLVKIIYRSPLDNLFHAPRVYYNQNQNLTIGLLDQEEHKLLTEYFKESLNNFKWEMKYDFDYVLEWIQYMLCMDRANEGITWNKIQTILLTKLAILRQLNPQKVGKILRNPIYACQLDKQIYQCNQQFLERKLNGTHDLVNVNKVDVLNEKAFEKIDGQIVAYSSNYICTLGNQQLSIYSTQREIKKIFQKSISSILSQPFNKKTALQQINEKDRELFSIKSEGPSIYKILAYCLDENTKQKEQYLQFSQRDLNQLIKDFNISEQDARAALTAKGNVEDAMVWLAQGGSAKNLKPRQNVNSSKNVENSGTHRINLLQLTKQTRNNKISPFCKLLLQIDNKILILGFIPKTNLLNKLEKGYIDMNNFSFLSQIKDIDTDSWCKGSDHPQMMVLDSLTNLNGESINIGFITEEQEKNLYLIVNNNDILMKRKIAVLSQNTYTNQSCFKLDSQQIPISQQFIDINQILISRKGQLYYQNTQKFQFFTETSLIKPMSEKQFLVLSNYDTTQENYITFKLQTGPNFSEIVSQLVGLQESGQNDEVSKQQNKWIPMLIQSGPPGCNLNYPICSILYPRAPFLANYPYSIKFKHLHSKYMKISSLKIQRINKNKAVNQIKQGVIYFSDDSGRVSKQYQFVFAPDDKQIEVQINQKGFWKYMTIIPTFKDKNQKTRKNPYQIGFVGAKGAVIDSNLFQMAVKDAILDNVHFQGVEQYQVLEMRGLQKGIYQVKGLLNIGKATKKAQIKEGTLFRQIFDVTVFSLKRNTKISQKDKTKKSLKDLLKMQAEELVRFLSKNLQTQSKAITFLIKSPSFSFKKFNDGQIRKFIDLLSMSTLTRKDYAYLFDKIYKQCEPGEKYFTEIISFLGASQYGGSLAFLNNLLMRMTQDQAQIILKDLLSKIQQLRSDKYQQLRSCGHPYLLLENHFYSEYYMKQIDKYTQKQTLSKLQSKIFGQESIKDIRFAVIKEQCLRKIIVDMKNIYTVTQLALRFQKTDFVNKLYIKVFCWTQDGNSFERKLIVNTQLLEHQWIQITKNPYRKQMIDMFGKTEGLDCFGLNLQGIDCRYLEIQLLHTVDGIHSSSQQTGIDPFIDIIPELYGDKLCEAKQSKTQISFLAQQFFQLKPEEMFFISKTQSNQNLSKFSVSKSLSSQFFYFEYQSQNIKQLTSKMHEKTRNHQYQGAIILNKKIIQQGQYSRRMGLDYAYTLYIKILKRLAKQNYKISRQIAQKISETMIQKQIGPIQQISLKSVSHYVDLVFDCLQFVKQNQAPMLQQIQLTEKEILRALKSQDPALCRILTNIIIKSLPCQPKWIQFVIQLTQITKDNQIATKFLLNYEHWYVNQKFLVYLSIISNKNQQKLQEVMSKKDLYRFLFAAYKMKLPIKYSQIIRSILNNKDPYIQDSIIEIILDQKPVNWGYLRKIVEICPKASEQVYSRFLNLSDIPKEMTIAFKSNLSLLYQCAGSQKHQNEFYQCIKVLFKEDWQIFKKIIMQCPDTLKLVSAKILDVIVQILKRKCDFGGVQGCILLTEDQTQSLHVANKLLKFVEDHQHLQFTKQTGLDLTIWYLHNCPYQKNSLNPINQSYGQRLIRNISSNVCLLLKQVPISIILKVFYQETKALREGTSQYENSNPYLKDLRLNTINYGVSVLLEKLITPEKLTDVLTGQGKMFEAILGELENIYHEKHNQETLIQNAFESSQLVEEEITESFQMIKGGQSSPQEIKDWTINRVTPNSKISLTKVPLSANKIKLVMNKNSEQEKQFYSFHLNKFVIGFQNSDPQNRSNILPQSVILYGGQTQQNISYMAQLKLIEDQYFTQYGVKVFGINFNTISTGSDEQKINLQKCRVLQVQMIAPSLCSVSDICQNSQKTNQNSLYHISFLIAKGFKQSEGPINLQLPVAPIHLKLLSFLSNDSYEKCIQSLINTPFFKTHFQKFMKVICHYLPDENIQKLLSLIHNKYGKVLQFLLDTDHVEKNNENTCKIIEKLLKARFNIQDLEKAIKFVFDGFMTHKYMDLISQCSRIVEYVQSNKKDAKHKIKFDQYVDKLIDSYIEKSLNAQKNQLALQDIKKLFCVVLNSSHVFEIDRIAFTHKYLNYQKDNSKACYSILASFITSDQNVAKWWDQKNATLDIQTQLLIEIQFANQLTKQTKNISSQKLEKLYHIINLLSTLTNNIVQKQKIMHEKFPLKVFAHLRNNDTLILKLSSKILKIFIQFFQNTCIQTQCSEQFSQQLIQILEKLPQTNTNYHSYFIHQFFFPLINTYKGRCVLFVWKGLNRYYRYPTGILQQKPIKASKSTIQFNGVYYAPSDDRTTNDISIFDENNSLIAFRSKKFWYFANGNEIAQNKFQITQKHKIYEVSNVQKNLLTNQTLIRAKNPSLFGKKYKSVHAFNSGVEQLYFLPLQIKIEDMYMQFNICGYRINKKTAESIQIKINGSQEILKKQTKIGEINPTEAILTLEIYAQQLFKYTDIQNIVQEAEKPEISFIPENTIFKTFEKLKGLQKMIKVMTTCVQNWKNTQQSKCWLQYLNQLSSFSCFPIFSSIYMNKQENVQLLFDILLELPDKEDNSKWIAIQKKSVKFLYEIIKDVFQVQGEQANTIRKYALESGFYSTMLQRLHIVTKQPKRVKGQQQEQQIEVPIDVLKKDSQDEYSKNKLKKKKGIGYGHDGNSKNQKWDLAGQQETRKEKSQQILSLLKILQKFLNHPSFEPPKSILQDSYESALLPILQSSLRGGSLLQISKYADLFQQQLQFINVIASKKCLIPLLLEIPKDYQPKQPQSIQKLIKTLEGTARIFLSCLTGSVTEKQSEEIAKNIIKTHQIVEEAIQHYKQDHVDQDEEKKILQLPLNKKYPLLMKDLRFDYIDMKDKSGKIKHHYNSYYTPNHVSPAQKTIRLAQQLADISNALPTEHTNAIYVRCDKERVDYMQALIMGSNGTPYGHGAYLFDIYFEDNYPNVPPKVNLTTTGSGKIRFNPNLYSCGKVCLSLLGTWRGNAMQNWDPKVSTLLQVLLSIQSIIMAQQVYFNQPGFQHEQGTPEGQKKNQGYSNIVRYGNVKFAMIQNLKKPPKGFETVIKRHFYLKKEEIMQECNKWIKYAEKRQASYNGLISDHNHSWATQFKKSKTQYLTMLQKAVSQLQQQLNKLQQPSSRDLMKKNKSPKKKKQAIKIVQSKDANIDEIDVTYDEKIDNKLNFRELDINDDKVKDRWSRYIGAMGIQAVNKQSKANILLTGLGPLGIQIAKNIVLSGCKKLSIYDPHAISWNDLSGQFYANQQDVGKNRLDATLFKLQELNHYVRVQKINVDFANLTNIKDYDVIIATQLQESQMYALNAWARKINCKFIANNCYGPFGYIFNDFGLDFEVLDKNGQETSQVMIQNITCEQQATVTLLKGLKHPYEDGQVVRINNVKGMINKDLQKNKQAGQSINESFHKIKVINQNSFKIGNTTFYTQYEGNGLARNMKMPIKMNFRQLQQANKDIRIDENLQYYDFVKGGNSKLLHACFRSLSSYQSKHKKMPKAWNYQDSNEFLEIIKQFRKQQLSQQEEKLVRKFSFTCQGNFAPLCAFFGGFTAQQAFKAITGKYMPVNQYFFIDYRQVIPQISKQVKQWPEKIQAFNYGKDQTIREIGLRKIIGHELLQKIQHCRVFVVGSGAIGCQLLKNYAMINLSTGQQNQTTKAGCIVVTDPDHIETSNLNRQFLFREKHLQKPKSVTAAAAVTQMNRKLKGKIRAKLDKVCQATKDIFTNQFFQSMNIVTNALDNVQARQYIDMRCVQNKIALLQSGTLSSKGHVQVILPFKTETYGSKADPAEEGQIPHCTLKMFPQETLHCVQWARDLFGKNFTLKPKALKKLLQMKENYVPIESDTQMLKDSLKMLKKKPANFDDCIFIATKKFYQLYRNQIKQLLYTYPLDSKTKDGKPFWKLPKRPPTPIQQIQDKNKLHAQFLASYAVLTAKIFNIPFPSDFRTQKRMFQIAQQAAKIKIEAFVPSDKVAKQMAQQVEEKQQKEQMMEQKQTQQKNQAVEGQAQIFQEIKQILSEQQDIKISAEQFQKDEDENGHIDLIYSMANLRADNYKLQAMDWITTKIKAGRITPALSTTTSCIAALQTIQLIKYLKQCKLQDMRNVFLNLAVPLVQSGEPGQVQKIKIHENLQTNIWERWQIGPISLTDTLKYLIDQIETKYSITVKVLSIASGGPIFSDIVLGLQSKKAQKQQLLSKSIKEIINEQVAIEDLKGFIDFSLVMSVKQQMVKHVPTIRMLIKE